MAAVQMNTRIDEALKAEGDAAFAELGYSPSEAVRLVWGFAARNRRNKRKMAEMIQRLKDPRETEAENRAEERRRAEAEEWVERWDTVFDSFFDETGLSRNGFTPTTSENLDEVLGEILDENMERIHRGLSREEYDSVLFERWRSE